MNAKPAAPLFALAFGLLLAGAASAAPTLKPEVDTAAAIVTVGDMFTDAGDLASKPLFLAPAPGTVGVVPLADVRLAAVRAGLVDFDPGTTTSVRVSRLATDVDANTLSTLLSAALKGRGVLTGDITAQITFDADIGDLKAAAVATPAKVTSLRYDPTTGGFVARFALAGTPAPLDLTGHIELMVPAPELVATLAAGTILSRSDIDMQQVPLRLVRNGNVATLDQLVGKQLQRQSMAGMVLKVSDVADPQVIARNEVVTVYLHTGALTLTIKGTALNAASQGQPVAVMNSASKKIVRGVARADGNVEITATPVSVAGL